MEDNAPASASTLALPVSRASSTSSPLDSNVRSVVRSPELLALVFRAYLALHSFILAWTATSRDPTANWRTDVQKRLTLKLVCRFWRATLVLTPELWSNIVLVPEMPQWYIDQVFRYAKATSKQLKIRLDAHSRHDVEIFSSLIAPLLVVVADTITHLSVQYGSHTDWNSFTRELSNTHTELNFSSLQRFRATSLSPFEIPFPDDNPHLFPGLTANIEHLHLDGLPITSSITWFTISMTRNHTVVFVENLLDCLRWTPRLNTLILGDLNESSIQECALHNHTVVLPNLQKLSYVCDLPLPHHCGFLVSLIATPQLHLLSIRLANSQNTYNFVSMNQSKLSIITELRLNGDMDNYVESVDDRTQLLPLLMGSRLRYLNVLEMGGLFDFNAEQRALDQTRFLEFLIQALSLPTICFLAIPSLFSPPHPASQESLMESVFQQVFTRGQAKYVFEEHTLCVPFAVDEKHLACARLWSWDGKLGCETRSSYTKSRAHTHLASVKVF
ncbi:hypothetical protein MIND_01124900 [Mycena indigotica]|uniref:F-box domain-containing protein n=1 Tax=Mycena indigotica TaxID=2126181 RepID=A0A8H6S812_9AGAR|nr:uncharacterized protein MIND_01124900 [Mycena indigotica]KAF7293472.1 hypothetical protein MIND_01124900 [Mycena indigotica]